MLKTFSYSDNHPMGMHGSTLSHQVRKLPSLDLRPDITEDFGKNLWAVFPLQNNSSQYLNSVIIIQQEYPSAGSQDLTRYAMATGIRIECKRETTPCLMPRTDSIIQHTLRLAKAFLNYLGQKIYSSKAMFTHMAHNTLIISKENKSTRLKRF